MTCITSELKVNLREELYELKTETAGLKVNLKNNLLINYELDRVTAGPKVDQR